MPADLALYGALAVLGLAVGFGLGRRTGSAARRVGELQAKVEDLSKERERLVAEVAAGREATAKWKGELDSYRIEVGTHFSGTSDLLRDLTHQYRAVYDHLTQGAASLFPEGFGALREGLTPDALPPGPDDDGSGAEQGADEAPPAPEREPGSS